MSKLLENKQLIHVCAETIVLLGMTYHFSQNNKKMSQKMDDLLKKINEQNEKIEKQKLVIDELYNKVDYEFIRNKKSVNFKNEVEKYPKKKLKKDENSESEEEYEAKRSPVYKKKINKKGNDDEKNERSRKIEKNNQNSEHSQIEDEIKNELSELEDNE